MLSRPTVKEYIRAFGLFQVAVWLIFPSQIIFASKFVLVLSQKRTPIRFRTFAAVGYECDVCYSARPILAFLEKQFLKLGPFHLTGTAGRIYLPLPLAYACAFRLLSQKSKIKRGPNPNSRKCKKGTQNLTKNFRKRDPPGLEGISAWGPNRDRRLGCAHQEKAARKPSNRPVLCPLIGENRSSMLRCGNANF
jgi:hypothetical protein